MKRIIDLVAKFVGYTVLVAALSLAVLVGLLFVLGVSNPFGFC